jgi:hypothetical protein
VVSSCFKPAAAPYLIQLKKINMIKLIPKIFKMMSDFFRKKLSDIEIKGFLYVPKQNLYLIHLNHTDRICSSKRS